MTGEQLKDELARIAEAAPEVQVPDDLFARGRRATVRARVLVGAAALACLALVAAITVPLLRSEPAGFADGDGSGSGGVPDAIYAPSDGELDLPRTGLADLGPAVATYPNGHGGWSEIVVVTQAGDYRLTELPGYDRMSASEMPPLLSPDGTLLAYPAADRSTDHLVILDLRSGETTKVDLDDGHGALARSAQWSPGGEWLSWSGQVVTFREKNHRKFGHGLAGVVQVATGESRRLPRSGEIGWSGLGVCDDGAALRFGWPAFFLTPPSGGVERTRSWERMVDVHGPCTPPVIYAAQADILAADDLVGWIPADDEALAVVVTNGANGEADPLLLAHTDGQVEVIGEVSSGVSGLSVATGLMTPERPTVPAGPDPWADPWIVDHWLELLAGVVGAGLLVLIVVRARAVRR